MTPKEAAFQQCAFMILNDQCPPDRTHYLCMMREDDGLGSCTQCWSNYLWYLTFKPVEPVRPSESEGMAAV